MSIKLNPYFWNRNCKKCNGRQREVSCVLTKGYESNKRVAKYQCLVCKYRQSRTFYEPKEYIKDGKRWYNGYCID